MIESDIEITVIFNYKVNPAVELDLPLLLKLKRQLIEKELGRVDEALYICKANPVLVNVLAKGIR